MAAPSPSSVTFADLLRHHRMAAGLTQEELAARAGLLLSALVLLHGPIYLTHPSPSSPLCCSESHASRLRRPSQTP